MSKSFDISLAAEKLLTHKFKRVTEGTQYIAGFTTANQFQLALQRCRESIYLWTESVSNQAPDSIKNKLEKSYSKDKTRSSNLKKNCCNLAVGNPVDYWKFESLEEFENFLDWYQTIAYVEKTAELKEISAKLTDSSVDLKAKRLMRLAKANKKPERKVVETEVFIRNPDVVVEVLERANGVCENCRSQAPFLRKSDNSPYLEVHHKIPLADDGDDTVENAIALCPNCHRKAHYG